MLNISLDLYNIFILYMSNANTVPVSNLINENMEPIDLLDLTTDNIYVIGDIFDEDNNTLYKFIDVSEDDMFNQNYMFLNINTGINENIPGYELNDSSVYDVTEPYNMILNRRKLEIAKQKFGKDIASNIGEHLGVSMDDIRDMYRSVGGGGKSRKNRVKSRKNRVKSSKNKSHKNRVKSRRIRVKTRRIRTPLRKTKRRRSYMR
jgi:hypothetical protein